MEVDFLNYKQSLKNFRDTLDFCLMYRVEHFEKIYEPDCQRNLANEIVANLLEKSLTYSEKRKLSFNNLLDYFNENGYEILKDNVNSEGNDIIEPALVRLRRFEKRFREDYEKAKKLSLSLRMHRPYISHMKSQQKGRYYDKAMLEFFSWYLNIEKEHNLILLTIDNRICSSKSVSSLKFAEAFRLYDQKYEESKAKANPTQYEKLDYIFKWMNFYRIESYFHFSLISELSERFLETKKDYILPHLNKIWGAGIGTKNRLAPAYQILRYRKYIAPVFSTDGEEDLSKLISIVLEERGIEDLLIYGIENRRTDLFENFYKQNKFSIDEVYNFCLNDYPIIENHKNSLFYENYKKSIPDKSKIRYARRIIKNILFLNN